MVKLQGPALSIAAAGGLAGQVVIANSPRGPYLKKLTPPKQPRTAGQVAIRTMISFLSKHWNAIAKPDQATWLTLAQPKNIAPYHAYLGENTRRWRDHLAPSEAYPAAEALWPTTDFSLGATGGVRHVRLQMANHHVPADCWIHLVFHSLNAAVPPDWNNLVHVELITTSFVNHYWTHTPLPAGTHYYRTVPALQDGSVDWTNSRTDSAIVT